jgi:GcrA cell cycle regulator
MGWTDERVSLLKQLWGEGKTAAEIAKLMGGGVSRNAVIGKAHRLKLSGRISPVQTNTRPETYVARGLQQPANQSRRPQVRNTTPKERSYVSPVAPPMVEDYMPGKGVKLTELREATCRWPLGDPKDENFRFCGCESVPGMPYCEHHARMAYQTGRSSKLKIEELAKIDLNIVRKA